MLMILLISQLIMLNNLRQIFKSKINLIIMIFIFLIISIYSIFYSAEKNNLYFNSPMIYFGKYYSNSAYFFSNYYLLYREIIINFLLLIIPLVVSINVLIAPNLLIMVKPRKKVKKNTYLRYVSIGLYGFLLTIGVVIISSLICYLMMDKNIEPWVLDNYYYGVNDLTLVDSFSSDIILNNAVFKEIVFSCGGKLSFLYYFIIGSISALMVFIFIILACLFSDLIPNKLVSFMAFHIIYLFSLGILSEKITVFNYSINPFEIGVYFFNVNKYKDLFLQYFVFFLINLFIGVGFVLIKKIIKIIRH